MTLRQAASVMVALATTITLATPAVAAADSAHVAKELNPAIVSVTPQALNPAPDASRVTVEYTLDVDSDSVTIEVQDLDGNTIFASGNLGPQTAADGPYSYDWSPVRDNSNAIPPDGRYKIVLKTATATDNGSDQHRVVLDATPPPIDSVTSDIGTLYPFRDGYLDVAHLTLKGIGRSAEKGWIEIKNASGERVRKLPFSTAHSRAHVDWNGKTIGGTIAPGGRYTYRAFVSDAVGNTAHTSRGVTRVSPKRAVAMTFTKTVRAASHGFPLNIAGRCSNLYSPGLRDWPHSVGYYSGVLCDDTSGRAGLARGLHAVHVPAAAWYDGARIRTWGGSTHRRDKASAEIQFLNGPRDYAEYGEPQTLGPKVGWHAMTAVDVGKLIKPDARNLGWSVTSRNGNWYDVKKFAVTLHYHVLRLP